MSVSGASGGVTAPGASGGCRLLQPGCLHSRQPLLWGDSRHSACREKETSYMLRSLRHYGEQVEETNGTLSYSSNQCFSTQSLGTPGQSTFLPPPSSQLSWARYS